MRGIAFLLLLALVGLGLWLLLAERGADVVLYCGVDQDQSRPMVTSYEEGSGDRVDYVGETEAMRSVGLPQRLLLEKDRPHADVYWSNEIMHMVHLAHVGVIDTLPVGMAETFPEAWRDPKGRFIQFGARARVLMINTELLPDPKDHPTSIRDLLNPKYAEMGLVTCMARPTTGTSYTHAVALLTNDEDGTRAFYKDIMAHAEKGHLKLVESNGQVMRMVRESGPDRPTKVAFGLTDTDDAWIALSELGAKARIVYPDQSGDGFGTVLIPNTAGLVKGSANREAGEKLLRWLASEDVEAQLAASRSAQIPVRPGVPVPEDGHVKRPSVEFRAARIDWYAVGANVDRWRDELNRTFRPAN